MFSFASCCPFPAFKDWPKILVCGLTVAATPNVFDLAGDATANRGFETAVDLTWRDGAANAPKVKEVESLIFTVSLPLLVPKTLLDETSAEEEGPKFLKPLNVKLPDDGSFTEATRLERILELVFADDESKANELLLWKPELETGFEVCDCPNKDDAGWELCTKTFADEIAKASALVWVVPNPVAKPLLAVDMMEVLASPEDWTVIIQRQKHQSWKK